MKKVQQGIEAIAVRRATLADADKVRYRVYRSEGDFVAVIAESALMAMKVSGISTPHRIVRDLPTEGVAIEAKRMQQQGSTSEQINLATERPKQEGRLQTAMDEHMPEPGAGFVAMQVKDFQKKKIPWARILTPEMVEQAQTAKAPTPPPAPAPPPVMRAPEPEPVPAPEPLPEPVMEAAPVVDEPSVSADDGVLSEEEVQKLLNS